MGSATDSWEQQESTLGTPRGDLVVRLCRGSAEGPTWRSAASKCTVGSAATATFRLAHPAVRPVHCLILRGLAGTVVRAWSDDIRLNGRRFQDAPLVPGDRLQFSGVDLEIVADSPVVAVPETTRVHGPARDTAMALLERLLQRLEVLEAALAEQLQQSSSRGGAGDREAQHQIEARLTELESRLAALPPQDDQPQSFMVGDQYPESPRMGQAPDIHATEPVPCSEQSDEGTDRQLPSDEARKAVDDWPQQTAAALTECVGTEEEQTSQFSTPLPRLLFEDEETDEDGVSFASPAEAETSPPPAEKPLSMDLREAIESGMSTASILAKYGFTLDSSGPANAESAPSAESAAADGLLLPPSDQPAAISAADGGHAATCDVTPADSPASCSSAGSKSHDDERANADDSIQQYMQRLLQRVNDGRCREPAAEYSPTDAGESSGGGRPETIAGLPLPAETPPAPDRPQTLEPVDPQPADPTERLTPDQFKPRSKPPEGEDDLQAMREVAAVTTHRAIVKFDNNRLNRAALSKILVAIVAAACGVMLLQWSLRMGRPITWLGAALGFVTAFVAGVHSMKLWTKILIARHSVPQIAPKRLPIVHDEQAVA